MPARRATRSAGRALSTGECAWRMSGFTISTTSASRRAVACIWRISESPGTFDAGPAGSGVRKKCQPVDVLFRSSRRGMLRAREMERLPAEAALLEQDRARAEGVPALQRHRVIEHVQDAEAHRATLARCARDSALTRSGGLMQRSCGRARVRRRPSPSGEMPRTSADSRAARCNRGRRTGGCRSGV